MTRRKTGKRSAAPADGWWRRVARAGGGVSRFCGPWLLRALPMLLLVGGTAFGVAYLWHYHLELPQNRLDAVAMQVRAKDGTLPPGAVTELDRLRQLCTGRSLLDPEVLSDLRAAYEESPWIASTHPFRRDMEGKTVITDFVLRLPAAQVLYRGRYFLLDARGVLLPTEGARERWETVPVVHCVLQAPPEPGRVWGSTELMDALNLLSRLGEADLLPVLDLDQITVVRQGFFTRSLHQRRTRPRIQLLTRSGATVRWGTCNPTGAGGELPDGEKLKMLRRILERGVPLARGDTIDVRTHTISYLDGPVLP